MIRHSSMTGSLLVVLAVAGVASADITATFWFDPNDWINNYSTDVSQTRIQQANPRLLINGVSQPTDKPGSAGTHTTYAGAFYSSTGIAGYQSQIASVEVHDFNMWLADGINAPNWGEYLTQAAGSLPSGTAANGWVVEVIDNPWPQAGYGGKLVQWYDAGYWDGDDSTAANPLTFGGADFDPFSFTVTLNDNDLNGQPVELFTAYKVWFGTALPVTWTSDPSQLVYSGNRRFEGTMELQAVPAPGALVLGAIGLGLIGRLCRRFA